MGVFKRFLNGNSSEKEAEKNAQQAEQLHDNTMGALDDIRQSSDRIIKKLSSIDWETLKNKESIKKAEITLIIQKDPKTGGEGIDDLISVDYSGVDYLNYAKPRVDGIIRKLNNQITAQIAELQATAEKTMLDTSSIDNYIYSFAGKFFTSLDKGDLRTANVSLSGMIYGVFEAHYPIDDSVTEDEALNEMSERLKNIQAIDGLIENAKHITSLEKVRNELIKNYRVFRPKAIDAYEKFKAFYADNQGLYEKISGMTGKEIVKAYGRGEEWKAWKRSILSDYMYDVGNRMLTQIELIESNIKEYEVTNYNLRNARLLSGTHADDKLRSKLSAITSRIPDAMTDLANNAVEAEKENKSITDNVNAAMDADKFIQAHAEAVYNHKEREEKELARETQREKDEEAATRKLEEEAAELEKKLQEKETKEKMNALNKRKVLKR